MVSTRRSGNAWAHRATTRDTEHEPGLYTVTFALPGFSTLVREGIELIGEATATVDGVLQVGSVEETITVTGAAPVVDVQNTRQQAVMTREIVDTIPTGKQYNNLGVLPLTHASSARWRSARSQSRVGARPPQHLIENE